MSFQQITKDLQEAAIPEKKAILQSFFKTGPGQYGEGDVFLGVTVPAQRKVAKAHRDAGEKVIKHLLDSKIHEHRLTALLILVEQFERGDIATRKRTVDLYLANIHRVNNWDLVDLSAPKILGAWLLDKDDSLLDKLARSNLLWERRIAMVATYAFIREGRFAPTLRLAKILLADDHDLMHKAVGWMLREVGKRDEHVLRGFLDEHTRQMPRTMLRYAIERLDEKSRKKYMAL